MNDRLNKQALQLVQAEQDVLAQAYQEQQRQQGHNYSYFDALDMVIGMAAADPAKFINEALPALREIAQHRGGVLFEVEYWKISMNKVTQEVAEEKLRDAEVPGLEVAMDPDEAALVGAFQEDALSEAEAKESSADLLEVAHG